MDLACRVLEHLETSEGETAGEDLPEGNQWPSHKPGAVTSSFRDRLGPGGREGTGAFLILLFPFPLE